MVLEDIGFIGISNNRSKAYVQRMVFAGLSPAYAIVLEDSHATLLPGQKTGDKTLKSVEESDSDSRVDEFVFCETEGLLTSLEKADISFATCPTMDFNSEEIRDKLQSRPEKIWIYSGPGGAILRKSVLSIGKKFLHVHPGLVPEYRGSTTLYYSLLRDNICAASAFFLAPRLDEGAVIKSKIFEPPEDRESIDYLYDPLIRSELLIDVLQDYAKTGSFEEMPQTGDGRPFYIIHPVLKHICILKRN